MRLARVDRCSIDAARCACQSAIAQLAREQLESYSSNDDDDDDCDDEFAFSSCSPVLLVGSETDCVLDYCSRSSDLVECPSRGRLEATGARAGCQLAPPRCPRDSAVTTTRGGAGAKLNAFDSTPSGRLCLSLSCCCSVGDSRSAASTSPTYADFVRPCCSFFYASMTSEKGY